MATKRKFVTIMAPTKVDLVEDRLVAPMEGCVELKADSRIVDNFAAVETPDSLLYFARRYGTVQPMHAQVVGDDTVSESVKSDLAVAARIRSMRLANTAIVSNQLPSLPVLEAFFGASAPFEQRRKRRAIPTIRNIIANELQSLITYCNLRPAFEWDAAEYRWRVGWTDLPEAPIMRQWFSCSLSAVVAFIAQDMTQVAAEPEPDVVCAVCGDLFPAVRTQQGRASYCPKCQGTPAMWRHIKRRQRARG